MVDASEQVDTSAPQNGAEGLDGLLAEFEASSRQSEPAPANEGPGEPQSEPQQRETIDQGPTLDDVADEGSNYWKLREQTAYAHRATEEAKQQLQQLARERDDRDTEILLQEIRGDLNPVAFPDKAIRAFIIGEATDNPALMEIFQQRASNPRAYEGLRNQLAREFRKMASARPDPDLTDDRDMVAAAVRGASQNKEPQGRPPAWGHMNNADFRNDVRNRYGFDPG